MRKILVIIFLGIISIMGYSQEFLHNPDYVYGMGDTDSSAVVSLSMSIGVTVTNETSYTITEKNKKVIENFHKVSGLTFSRILHDINVYYDNSTKTYYRYINKKEYIEKRLNKCKEYEHFADSINNVSIKHGINLTLGYYYKAYKEITTPLFEILTQNEYKTYCENIKNKAKRIYLSGDYGVLIYDSKRFDGYWVVTNNEKKSIGNPPALFAFEYFSEEGWISPSHYTSEEGEKYYMSFPNDGILYNKCFVYGEVPDIQYRITYEDMNGKMDVFPEWYFAYFKIMNLKFLN